jgi:hypothetical protein
MVVRGKTLRPVIFERSVRMSSVIPSRRYSSSLTPERFSKYSTAIERAARRGGFESAAADAPERPPSSFRRRRSRSVLSSVAVW